MAVCRSCAEAAPVRCIAPSTHSGPGLARRPARVSGCTVTPACVSGSGARFSPPSSSVLLLVAAGPHPRPSCARNHPFFAPPPPSLWYPPSPRAGRGLCRPRICRPLHLLCCGCCSGAPACYTHSLLAHCCCLPLVSHHSWAALAVLPCGVRPLALARVCGPLYGCLLSVLLLPTRASQLW